MSNSDSDLRKQKIARAIRGNPGGGEILVLSNGEVGTAYYLWRRAVSNGFDGCLGTFSKRLSSGCRDLKELCRPVDKARSQKSMDALRKKKQGPEFLAALAAVAERRGQR